MITTPKTKAPPYCGRASITIYVLVLAFIACLTSYSVLLPFYVAWNGITVRTGRNKGCGVLFHSSQVTEYLWANHTATGGIAKIPAVGAFMGRGFGGGLTELAKALMRMNCQALFHVVSPFLLLNEDTIAQS